MQLWPDGRPGISSQPRSLGQSLRPDRVGIVRWVVAPNESCFAGGIVPGMLEPELKLSTLGDMECVIGAETIAHHLACDISHIEIADTW